jgi:4-alpha-glucanotransferase
MASNTLAREIAALGRLMGITPGFRDNQGRRHRTCVATYQALLTAMGVPWEDEETRRQELERRLRAQTDRLLPPVTGLFFPDSVTVMVKTQHPSLPSTPWARVELTSEEGQRHSWERPLKLPVRVRFLPVAGGFRVPAALPLPQDLKAGYYDLKLLVDCGSERENAGSLLIVAPKTTFQPPCLAGGRRLWGLNLPLYAITSKSNWGMGDFTDLAELIRWAGDLGADFVGVNPLHAPPPLVHTDISPYFPSSRQFLNFLYLDLEKVPEFQDSPEAQALMAHPAFQADREQARASPLVTYELVFRLKRELLGLLFETFSRKHGLTPPLSPRGQEFWRFVEEAGEGLQKFARFSALAEYFREADWRCWPAAFQQPEAPAVAAFAREHPREILFHQYLQWLTETQLRQAQQQAYASGLFFTLYQDLALGANPGGYETWAYPGLFARGAALGAPPDAFNPKGQNWGLPPMIPERLKELRFQPFIDILKANLPVDGMLRLDHVMGLFRQFWLPYPGEKASGAYVRYPDRELLAILALESWRRRTLIIGEDLGTVAPYIRRELKRKGIFSYRVFYFERRNHDFLEPQEYPREALAAVSTHDLPTLAGYWEGRDIQLKKSLDLYPLQGMAQEDEARRAGERRLMVAALIRQGLLPEGYSPPPAPCPAAVRRGVLAFLARSRAALFEVRLEDLLGLTAQQNLPGTTSQHPNWRQKIFPAREDLSRSPEIAELTGLIRKERGKEKGGFRESH